MASARTEDQKPYRTSQKTRDRARAYYAKNRTQCRAKQNAARQADPRPHLLCNARKRAKDCGLPFTITVDDIPIPDRCPVFDTPIEAGVGGVTPNSPSVDRLIPALGYVPGNVRVISNRANTIKSDATAKDLRAVLAYLENEIGRTAASPVE